MILQRKEIIPWELIGKYSQDSTIHGVKYIGDKNQHWIVKLFWLLIFTVCIYYCVQNILDIKTKRQEQPVMISFSKKLSPTFEIPFPAVSICPESKAKIDSINITEVMSNVNLSKSEMEKLSALANVCEFDEEFLNFTGTSDVIKILQNISLLPEEYFEKCRYGSTFESCTKLFHKVITDEGICQTFNMFDESDLYDNETMIDELKFPKHGKKSTWFLDKDYDSIKVKVYPMRVLGSGIRSGLTVKFKMNSTLLNNCGNYLKGFKLSLNMPVDIPKFSKQFYAIPFSHQTTIVVKPQMIYASKDIKDYTPESRQCYFGHERKLKYFKIYSQSNCELECKSNFVYEKCNCTKFSMPRNYSMSVCDHSKNECVYEATANYSTQELEKKLLQKQLKRDLKHGKLEKNNQRFEKIKEMEKSSCNCLPSCTVIKYDVEIDRVYYEEKDEGFLTAEVNIYFKDSSISRLKRYEIYGWSDFLSNCGGTLGLFLGCSFVSFIELGYHILTYVIRKIKSKSNSIAINEIKI